MKGEQRRTVLIILIILAVSVVACSPPTPPRITPGSLASMRALSNTNQQTQYMGATDDYGEDALAVGPGSTLGRQDPSHNMPRAHVAAQRRFL